MQAMTAITKIKVGILGKDGKMGKVLSSEIEKNEDLELSASLGREDSFAEKVNAADIWIDFSTAEKYLEHAEIATKAKKPILICTTGKIIDHEKLKLLDGIVMHASNTSINWLQVKKMILNTEEMEELLMEDIHYHTKVDSPSGTSLDIGNAMQTKGCKVTYWSARNTIQGAKIKAELVNQDEMITVSYTTFNRQPYAKGALLAAKWLLNKAKIQSKDFYTTDDFLSS